MLQNDLLFKMNFGVAWSSNQITEFFEAFYVKNLVFCMYKLQYVENKYSYEVNFLLLVNSTISYSMIMLSTWQHPKQAKMIILIWFIFIF